MPTNQPLVIDIGEGLSIMLALPTLTSWKTKDRPNKVKMGTIGFNSQTNRLEYWNGSYWLEATMDKA